MFVKKYLALYVRLFLRHFRDLTSGNYFRLAGGSKRFAADTPSCVWATVEQPILPSATVSQKIHNLRLAIRHVENRMIRPGEVFSFWHWIGAPTARRGYQKGRTISRNVVSSVTGGGLCQLSGIMYHTALLAGLQSVERHAHSVDIYVENERHTPLGADATVVYGYKDFRVLNSADAPVFFTFYLDEQVFRCSLHGSRPQQTCQLSFSRADIIGGRTAVIQRIFPDGRIEEIESRYKVGI
jgi:vancomycin resistance protein VanW